MTDPFDAFHALRQPHEPAEPDPVFAAALREALRAAILGGETGGKAMTTAQVQSPARTRSLAPYLAVRDARAAVDFYVEVFGATRLGELIVMADGKVGHAEVAIGDSVLMLAEEFPEVGNVVAPEGGAAVRVEVPDARAAVDRAVELGAEPIGPVEDRGHGVMGRIRDPFGQRWLVAQATGPSPSGVSLPPAMARLGTSHSPCPTTRPPSASTAPYSGGGSKRAPCRGHGGSRAAGWPKVGCGEGSPTRAGS